MEPRVTCSMYNSKPNYNYRKRFHNFFFSLSQWDIFHNVNTQTNSKSSVGKEEEEQRKDGKFYESSSG